MNGGPNTCRNACTPPADAAPRKLLSPKNDVGSDANTPPSSATIRYPSRLKIVPSTQAPGRLTATDTVVAFRPSRKAATIEAIAGGHGGGAAVRKHTSAASAFHEMIACGQMPSSHAVAPERVT